jgi:hypothetical protein
MSNHFPTIPTLNLTAVTYEADWTSGNLQHLDGFDVTGVVPMNEVAGPQILGSSLILNVPFNFTTPGDAGSFDQDASEAAIAAVLDEIAQAVATATDETLATVQGWITVQRQWFWQDSSFQYNLTHNDTMTYPVS